MKLRLDSSSIRLRLRKSDIKTLTENGLIETVVSFPNQAQLSYQLRLENDATDIDTVFLNDIITVKLPLSMTMAWINSEEVGIEKTLSNGLYILIEKDFPCKDRPWEDKNDTFFELSEQSPNQC